MLRKVLNIILVSILLISTTGFNVSQHYCGTRLVDVKLNNEVKPCCGTKSSCCHNEVNHYKLDEDFSFANRSIEMGTREVLISLFESEPIQNFINESFTSIVIKPPGVLFKNIVKITCCFLI
ncbi:hypothetical protein ACFLTE_07485 [Bacteroidota bacterium]